MDYGRHIALINAASQLGAGRRASGTAWEERVQPIVRHLESCGVTVTEFHTITEPEPALQGEVSCRYFAPLSQVLHTVYDAVSDCLARKIRPVILGGDHSLAIGSASAAADYLRSEDQPPPGLLWVDAHIDMNTPQTSPSGNMHGMALAALLGIRPTELCSIGKQTPAIKTEHAAVIGYRFADRAELPNLLPEGPALYSMRDIDRLSLDGILNEALRRVAVNTGGIHLSIDVDSLDPSVAPAVNTPWPGGLMFRELRMICERIASTGRLLSVDIVEHNPEKGHDELLLPIIGELIACCCGTSAMPDLPPPGQTRLPGNGDDHGKMV